ncbi:methylisocitrate lyase [Sporosarcina saromensis]|uniref:Methylisocitrate lyase n=1 Tax=Sporosarcina saromensis TaxID=359365 RepID=A0ABU4G9J7_9BACL|nr:methylisocitrate lyase [Sporosarcina saromensis]MDW0113020.1 methylisocitrate lyase [Sporosarcina saromensis]
MTWLITEQKTQKELSSEFLSQIKQKPILKIIGAHDGMSALIGKKVGFEALYLSGAAFTASKGLPDLGILHSQEVAERARELTRATGLPLLVDIDTGFGGVLNVARTAKEMVEANVAAVQIEDQDLPKKCGHLNGKKLIPAEEMAQKIKAIKEVAPSLIVIARTDALAVEGFEAAVKRMKLYVEAGADGLFPEALTTEEEFRQIGRMFTVPLLANMTEFGKTDYYTAEEFEDFGFSMVIYPVTSLRAAAKAYEDVFKEIFAKGTQKDILHRMQTRKELYETIKLEAYEELDGEIAKTVLPE